jgi:hypothetical protein
VVVRYATTLTSEQYVTQQAWRTASLERCPLHPEGGCGLGGHGSYRRVRPAGVRVARLRCPKAGVTISLLPDFLAARLSGTLAEVEQAVEVAEGAGSREQAAGQVRRADEEGAVTLPSALRWLRRRLAPVRAALLALVTLLPELSGCAPTLAAVRERLEVREALVALRALAEGVLPALAAPLGFRARAARVTRAPPEPPHEVGPDPPDDPG